MNAILRHLLVKAASFPVTAYTAKELSSTFKDIKAHWPNDSVRVAVWNVGVPVFKEFLDITEDDLSRIVEGDVNGPFAFSQEAIRIFKGLEYVFPSYIS